MASEASVAAQSTSKSRTVSATGKPSLRSPTLDQFTGGRIAVHIITGGSDDEMRRDGDHLTKDERYARTDEYLDIVRLEWSSPKPFDYKGKYYNVEGAWKRAKEIEDRTRELREQAGLKTAGHAPPNAGSQRLLAAAAQGSRLDKRLWAGVAAITGASGNSTGLVGTPEQVADAMLDYHDLGVSTFLIRGFDPLEDAIAYGRDLIPLVRDLVAARGANPVRVAS
jgi:alkanesulfonate monooxygenase SsuD/methylene tetrahydromethanopterin reductase-like flavin-dependent oxidoreductase (luciferase family)